MTARVIRDQAALDQFTAGAAWVDLKVRLSVRRRPLLFTVRTHDVRRLGSHLRLLHPGLQCWVRALPTNADDWTAAQRARRITWLTLEALDREWAESPDAPEAAAP